LRYKSNFPAASFVFVLAALSSSLSAQTVRFHTNLGDIDVALTPSVAPATVANFLSYMNKGLYANTIFHRSVGGFVVQGGGFQLQGNLPVATATDPPVKNEFNVSNTRGTIAMAKVGNDANSATNQWFFNLDDNGGNLDGQNGGFTVFGKIVNNAGLQVMDRIAAQPVYSLTNINSAFDSIPLTGYKGTGSVVASNYVSVISVFQIPVITTGGVQSAASFATTGITGVAPGEFIAIYGQSMGPSNLATLTVDGNGIVNTSLGGTRVLFDGTPAPIVYTSAAQISVVAPYNLAGKDTVKMVVEYQGVQGTGLTLAVVPANPAIFTLNSSGTGDGAIVRFSDGAIISSKIPASVGDILILFGEGQGATAPALADGAIVGSNLPYPTVTPVLLIDGQAVPTDYAGGAPSLINGVLQVNFKVPQLAAGTHQIQLRTADRTSPSGVTLVTK
jgi:uncharacterized protein (TIGR03437 family)